MLIPLLQTDVLRQSSGWTKFTGILQIYPENGGSPSFRRTRISL